MLGVEDSDGVSDSLAEMDPEGVHVGVVVPDNVGDDVGDGDDDEEGEASKT